jgi:hypothetical protein
MNIEPFGSFSASEDNSLWMNDSQFVSSQQLQRPFSNTRNQASDGIPGSFH